MSPAPRSSRPRRAIRRLHQRLGVRIGALAAIGCIGAAGVAGVLLQTSFASDPERDTVPVPAASAPTTASTGVPDRVPSATPTEPIATARATTRSTAASTRTRTPSARSTVTPPVPPTPARQLKKGEVYQTCEEAAAAGALPIRKGDRGFGPHLDRNGNGIGCEAE